MFEIWRHRESGERYLVVVRDGTVNAAAGPLGDAHDPRRVLEAQANQHDNPWALLHMRHAPEDYEREYTTSWSGHAIKL